MSTICSTCGSTLAAAVRFCPRCGAPTSSFYADSAASPYEPTVPAAPFQTPSQIPATLYGRNPYGAPLPNPYEPLNPYEVPPPPPPPPPSRRPKLGLLLGIAVLVLTIVSVSVVAVLTQQAKNTPTGDTSPSSATSAQTSILATGTAHTEKNPYPPYTGTLVLNDPLSQPSAWSEDWDSSFGGACQFSNGAYHISQSKPNALYVCSEHADFGNFTFEVQMKILKGNCGGLQLRDDGSNGKNYIFEICQDGTYNFYRYVSNTSSDTLSTNYSSAISSGGNQSDVIAVVANGSTFALYVNNQEIATVSDSSYTHGTIGLLARESSSPTEVVYSNAKVWTL